MRPPLTTSMTRPVDRLGRSVCLALDLLPGQLEASPLLREDQPTLCVLLREHERIDLVSDDDLVLGVHRPANRELGDRDDALRLVADVDEHLVLVHADDGAVHDLTLVDLGERRVVVRNQLAIRTRGSRRRAPAAAGFSTVSFAIGSRSIARFAPFPGSSGATAPAASPGVEHGSCA